MGRRRFGIWTATAVALLAAGAPAAAHSGVIVRSGLTATEVKVGTTGFTVSCPRNRVAVSGSVFATPPGVTTQRTAPVLNHASQWSFVFQSTRAGTVETLVRCIRYRVPVGVSVRVPVATIARTSVDVSSHGGTEERTLTCPKNLAPTGWGYDLKPKPKPRDATGGTVGIYGSKPVRGRWLFGLRNDSSKPGDADVYVRCLQRRTRARGRRGAHFFHRLTLRRKGYLDSLAPGQTQLFHRCRRSDFSLATGFWFDPVQRIDALLAHPEGEHSGRWLFANNESTARTATTYALCLDGRTTFRRRR